MPVTVRQMLDIESGSWDEYVTSHPQGNVYQQLFWGKAIGQIYGHRVYNLVATETDDSSQMESIVGILPLVHIKHFIFGNSLISMPYADFGGVLSKSPSVEQSLLDAALKIASQQSIPSVEFRHADPTFNFRESSYDEFACFAAPQQKVRMLLELPQSVEYLMQSFKSKLRSQIRRPQKEGLRVTVGSKELMNDFYAVFSENMRDLGSPVHSKAFVDTVIDLAGERARIFVVYRDRQPLACSMTLANGATLSNPWASSLRRFSSASPNMLLYWTMLEYGCENGFRCFDFGRSTPGEGTYNFKKQWGAVEKPLHWTTFSKQDGKIHVASTSQKSRFNSAMHIWKKMPVSVTRVIGPVLRRNIGL
jgi:serine/alanine adding enzyme